MSTLTVKISGVSVNIRDNSFRIKSRVDNKDSCVFTVVDSAGTAAYTKGQPVVVSDSSLGTLFQGYINKPTATNLYPQATNLWSVDCVSQFYVAAKKTTFPTTGTKRHRGGKHKNQHAGAIVANQIQEYLAPDGVSGNFGLDWSELQADWQMGTQAGVAATTNTSTGNEGAGDLELALAGAQVTATGVGAQLTQVNGLALTGTASSGYSNAYTYRQIWSGSIATAGTDSLTYDVWVSSSSPQIKAAVDLLFSDGSTLSASAVLDQQSMSCAPPADLSGLANDQWYSRSIVLTGVNTGKTLVAVSVALGGTSAGNYQAYFRRIVYNGSAVTTIFGDASTLSMNAQSLTIGYTNVALNQVLVSNKTGTVTHSSISISSAGIALASQIAWTATLPNGCSAILETSIDNGASWQAATSGNAIPDLIAGVALSGRSLQYRQTLTLGTDPTAVCSLSAPAVAINPSYASTKTDVVTSYTTTADFNTGTLTNLKTSGSQGVTLNGYQKNWADGNWQSQGTNYISNNNNTIAILNKQLQLTCLTGSDFRARLDLAGQWQNFTAEVDVQVPASGNDTGIVYRTTGWQSNVNTFAYYAGITASTVFVGRGTNSSSGTGTFTSIASFPLTLAANSIHRLKIVINGNTHTIFVDGVQYISATDATYPAAGYLGLKFFNNAGSTLSSTFANFGVVAALSGIWQSPAINIAGATTYGGSEIFWDIDGIPDSTCSIAAQTSIDGGTTFQNVTNGGAISGLVAGQSLAAKTLILKLTLTASNAQVVPVLNGVTGWVLGQYSSSGSRSTAPLAWDSMKRLNVASGFGAATNSATYTQTGTGTTALSGNEATISNTTGDVHMQIGSTTQGDTDETVRFSLSASTITAGMELRYSDVNDFYRLAASTTTVSIIKVSGGVSITLASVSMTITTATFYRMRFRVVGSGAINPINLYGSVWLDGTSEPTTFSITATD